MCAWLRVAITGTSRVSLVKNSGKRMVDFCVEMGLCGGNTYFEYKSLHKLNKGTNGQDGMEVKSMIDLVLVKKDMLSYV